MTHPQSQQRMRMQVRGKAVAAGFTLIEVMIVVAVVAILSAIALPAYTTYITRGRIPDATSALSSLQVKMEQYFQDNKTYNASGSTTACGVSSMPATKFFNYACATTSTTAYTITATGFGAMTGFTYTIDQNGNKQTTSVPSGLTSSTTCWITNKGGVC